jgi:hypothetical protein
LTHYTQADSRGRLAISAEEIVEINEGRQLISSTLSGKNLPATSFFTNPSSFITIARSLEGKDAWSIVWRSKTVNNSSTPNWGTMKLTMSELCNADLEREIKITLWEYHEDGHHEEKGFARIVAKEFIQRETGKGEMSLNIHDKKNEKTVCGQFVLGEPTVETRPGFVKVNRCWFFFLMMCFCTHGLI